MLPLRININIHVRDIKKLMRSRRHAFIKQIVAVKDLCLAHLGEDVRVFDGDALRFRAPVGSGRHVGVEDAFAAEGRAVFGLDDCAVGVVFKVYGKSWSETMALPGMEIQLVILIGVGWIGMVEVLVAL